MKFKFFTSCDFISPIHQKHGFFRRWDSFLCTCILKWYGDKVTTCPCYIERVCICSEKSHMRQVLVHVKYPGKTFTKPMQETNIQVDSIMRGTQWWFCLKSSHSFYCLLRNMIRYLWNKPNTLICIKMFIRKLQARNTEKATASKYTISYQNKDDKKSNVY